MSGRLKSSELYGIMLESVVSAVDRQALCEALEEPKRGVRFDRIQELLRRAVIASTLCCYNTMPYVYTGRIYEQAAKTWRIFDNLVYDVMRECGVPDGHYGRVRSMAAILESAVRCKVLEPDPSLMVFRNCIFDTETCETDTFSPQRVAVTMVDYDYDPDDQPVRWLMFLNRVLPDKCMQSILQEFLGAVFIRRSQVKIEKMLVLLGGGANGKSVIFETVRGILGEENVKTFGLGALMSSGEKLKNIATINGRRLNYSSEMQMRDFGCDAELFKKLVSGEPQEARYIGENPFSATDIPLLMANANHIPAWNDPSSGMRRRFLIIPFKVEIPPSERDPELATKLRDDYSGIFNWMMDGRRQFISNGYRFSENAEMERMLDEYQAESSTVLRFMLDRGYMATHPDKSLEGVRVRAQDLYADYIKWCMTENIAPADTENRNKFGRILRSVNYRKKDEAIGVVYTVFCNRGEIPIPYIREKGDEGRRKEEPKADMRPFTENGRKWVRTRTGISRHLDISESIIASALKEGYMQKATRRDTADPRMVVFDVEMTRKAVQEYLSGKKRSEEEKEEASRRSDMRNHFNARMKKIGEPYRKYDSKWDIYLQANSDGIIRVPDDWSYDDEIPLEKQSSVIRRRRVKRDIDIQQQ